MAASSVALDPHIGQENLLWSEQISGLTGILGRAPDHLSLRSQALANKEAVTCSNFPRNPAHPRKCLAGEGSSSEGWRQEQELWRRQVFLGPTVWWDNRQLKSFLSPYFLIKGSHEVLWLNNFYKPAWVDEQLAALDMQMGRGAPTSKLEQDKPGPGRPAKYEMGVTAVAVITKCQQGKLTEAVDALEALVQTDCRISKSLFYTVLRPCVAKKDLVLGRRVHALTFRRGYESDTFLCNHILRMYASHDRLQEAMDVFNLVVKPDAFTWSSIISAHVKHGQAKQAIQLYHHMRSSSVKPDGHVFVAALQACARGSDLETGLQVHADVLASGVEPDLFVVSCLVDMYAKCGNLKDAQSLFDGLEQKNVVTWNAMIAGYAQQGMGEEALHLYSAMQKERNVAPDSVTFVCLLQACASVGTPALEKGKQFHAQIREQGLQADAVIGGSLVNMYAKCGSLEMLDKPDPGRPPGYEMGVTAVTVSTKCRQGKLTEAVGALELLVQTDCHISKSLFYTVLKQCVAKKNLVLGRRVHDLTVQFGYESDTFFCNHILRMYASYARLQEAMDVFTLITKPDAFTWSSIISAHVNHGQSKQAIHLYHQMRSSSVEPDGHVFVAALQACARGADLESGRQVHADVLASGVEPDLFVVSCLVDMYAKCGSLKDAQRLFDGLCQKNVVTWNAMLAGYAQQGMGEEALHLYNDMEEEDIAAPDSVTFVCLLQACASVGTPALEKGKQFHACIREQGLQGDVAVGGSLVNMYAKCGSLEDAQRVFDRLRQKDVVTWTAMIAGYVQKGMGKEALHLYSAMQQEGIAAPDSGTFVCLLQACAIVAALHPGRQLHAQIKEQGLQADVVVANSLINMYAKCGNMADAQQVFDALPERDIVTWTALIAGYTRQGDSELVFSLVDKMTQDNVQPDSITFLSVLTVCSHAGLVDKGREHFEAMSRVHGITPTVEHYTCMVDVLGRAGQLDEAVDMVRTMPVKPNDVVWHALLGACRKWSNVELGRYAFDEAVKIDKKDAAAYVMMCNIYTGAQMWEEAQQMQARRKKIEAWKQPGQSWWTDMSGIVHAFLSGDKKHPETEGIYARLKQLIPKMKKEGYVPDLDSSLRGITDDEKEAHLCGHSEKLAIAYALNKTPEGTTIRIVKNLRVCDDCHKATVYISKIEKRTIICRDASRFHVYKEGKCSCGDYW